MIAPDKDHLIPPMPTPQAATTGEPSAQASDYLDVLTAAGMCLFPIAGMFGQAYALAEGTKSIIAMRSDTSRERAEAMVIAALELARRQIGMPPTMSVEQLAQYVQRSTYN